MLSCTFDKDSKRWFVDDSGSTYSFASLDEANEFCLKCRMARKNLWFSHKESGRDSILGIAGLVFTNKDNEFIFVPLVISATVYEVIHQYGTLSAAYNALKSNQNQNETSA